MTVRAQCVPLFGAHMGIPRFLVLDAILAERLDPGRADLSVHFRIAADDVKCTASPRFSGGS
jgi:hypothetical protein